MVDVPSLGNSSCSHPQTVTASHPAAHCCHSSQGHIGAVRGTEDSQRGSHCDQTNEGCQTQKRVKSHQTCPPGSHKELKDRVQTLVQYGKSQGSANVSHRSKLWLSGHQFIMVRKDT